MTVRLLVCCDGTPDDRPGMALETCRAYLPTSSSFTGGARAKAIDAGWHCDLFGRDLCPACIRAINDQHRKDPTP